MEFMLQTVVVVFMLFLCALCLFAVVVIARDIIHENAKNVNARKNENEQEKAVEPIQVVVQPAPTVIMPAPAAEPAPVEEPTPAEEPAPAPVETAVPVEESTPAEEPAPVVAEPVAEVVATEVSDEEEIDPDAVTFSRVSLTLEEKYATLSTEFKRHFDDIIRHALSKEGVKEMKRSAYYDYKIGSYRVLRITIKRGEIVCEFNFIDKDFAEYSSASDVKMKRSATTVRVLEASAVGVVKDGIDLVCSQIAGDKERKKELAREKRREKRRLLKGSTDTEEVETSEGEE